MRAIAHLKSRISWNGLSRVRVCIRVARLASALRECESAPELEQLSVAAAFPLRDCLRRLYAHLQLAHRMLICGRPMLECSEL